MKILLVTLSNIGDAVLTLPVLDYLKTIDKDARITCICGVRPREIFEGDTRLRRVIVYDKKAPLRSKLALLRELRAEKFDAVIDLRNGLFGYLVPARLRIPWFLRVPRGIRHMKDRHLFRARMAFPRQLRSAGSGRQSFFIAEEDRRYIRRVLEEAGLAPAEKVIVVACGARSSTKRWGADKFRALCPLLGTARQARIVLVGDEMDSAVAESVAGALRGQVINLCAKTSVRQLAALMERAQLAVVNDSAVLHIASYFDVPVVGIFGPTSDVKYGPWSAGSRAVKKDIFCRPCQQAQCRFGTLRCLELVGVQDVVRAAEGTRVAQPRPKKGYDRILLARTDRIGDVLLSTPVIRAVREACPGAYIAMVVAPAAREIVEGNPWLDEVFVYDKHTKHKSILGTLSFALRLRQEKFDLAFILHPSARMHAAAFFAGIRRRIGYNRKLGFLLTERLPHRKHLGEKHESEYVLDMARYAGIEAGAAQLYMPLRRDAEAWADELLAREGIKASERILALHPAASCPSKIWPGERFARVADALAEKYGFRVALIAGPRDTAKAEAVAKAMKHTPLNLAARTSVSQLASFLKRCSLFISNDSGPVHIASAVGTPVIAVFGRNQKGLSPRRWGPLGRRDKALHKAAGCVLCLAHNCTKEFACLKSITAEDVLAAADEILKDESRA